MSHVLHLQTLGSLRQTSEFENFLASTTSTICPVLPPTNGLFQSK
jgi:hypothetical protein